MDQASKIHPLSNPLQSTVSKGLKRRAPESGSRTNSRGSKAARGNTYGDVHIGDQAHAVVGDVVHHHHYNQDNAERSDLQHAKRSFVEILVYPGMTQRINDIPTEHEGTFEWAFDDSMPHKWNSFRQWLSGDEKFYWVSGKAGSGKSTLMKMMWSHSETRTFLQRGSNDACILKHSFWLPGTPYQKNFKGLLFSLVNQSLSSSDALVEQLLIEMEPLQTKKEITSWSTEELSQLSKRLLCARAASSLVCLFLDGLDEIETVEDQEHVLDYLDDLATLGRVKVCVSSRSEEPWTSQFSKQPRLRLQDLTTSDITRYARARLQKAWSRGNPTRVTDQQLDGIVNEIGIRAEGVFLWARLAVTSLLRISKGASAGEISARLNRLPNEIADLYRDMLRRRDEEPASVMEEAASYLKLLVDPWGMGLFPPTVRLCLALRRLRFGTNIEESAVLTLPKYLSERDQMEDRIRDICAGMVTLAGRSHNTNNDSIDAREAEEEDRHVDVHLGFHHRSVFDFLTDHVDGRAFLESSRVSENDLLTACVDAECLPEHPHYRSNVFNAIWVISEFHRRCPSVGDFDKAQAIRRLICRMNVCDPKSRIINLADVGYVDESPEIFQNFFLDGRTPYDRPAIDIVGYSLLQGIPSFFNIYLAQYLAPVGADGRMLTKDYMDYLLDCSIRGDLPEVAIRLIRAGANLHALRPRNPGCCWLRRTSDELAALLFGPREGRQSRSFRPLRGERLHTWRQVLAEHNVQSSYSVFYWPFSNQILSTSDGGDRYEPLLMVIDIGRCCEIVKDDIGSRGPEDVTRTVYEVAPKEYIGFVVNFPAGTFIPVSVETLHFIICRNTDGRLEGIPNAIDSTRERLLQFKSWKQSWLRQDDTDNLHTAQELRDLEMREKAEMFETHAIKLGLMYGDSENETASQGLIPRFEDSVSLPWPV